MYEWFPLSMRQIAQLERDEGQYAGREVAQARLEAVLIGLGSEDVATTVASRSASPHTVVVASSGSNLAPSVGAASALDLGDTLLAYSPSTPSYRPILPERVPSRVSPYLSCVNYRSFGSPTYTPVSPL
jgi:hypothetical protein